MQLTTITTKGQVTIPKDIRDKFGLLSGNKVIFEDDGDSVKVSPAPNFFSFRGSLKGKRIYNAKKDHGRIGQYLARRYSKSIK